jgi:hypothetical protein
MNGGTAPAATIVILFASVHTPSRQDATRPSCPRARAVHSEAPQRLRSSPLHADRRRCEQSDERWHGAGNGDRDLVRVCAAHVSSRHDATRPRCPRARAVLSEGPQCPSSSLLHVDRRRCEQRNERWHSAGGGDRDLVRGCAAHAASHHNAIRPRCPRTRTVLREVRQRPRSSPLQVGQRRCEKRDERWHGAGGGDRDLVRGCAAHKSHTRALSRNVDDSKRMTATMPTKIFTYGCALGACIGQRRRSASPQEGQEGSRRGLECGH